MKIGRPKNKLKTNEIYAYLDSISFEYNGRSATRIFTWCCAILTTHHLRSQRKHPHTHFHLHTFGWETHFPDVFKKQAKQRYGRIVHNFLPKIHTTHGMYQKERQINKSIKILINTRRW